METRENPADAISRGQPPSDFLKNTLWEHGPHWLAKSEEHWPPNIVEKIQLLPELRKTTCLRTTIQGNSILLRFSSFERLKRVVAYCLRWKEKNSEKFLTLAEMETAETRIIKILQENSFFEEKTQLQADQSLSSKNRLNALNPFIDKNGIIRVGGRLQKSDLSYDTKHPILLPRSHHVSQIIITEFHLKNMHAGVQSTLSLVRQKYWILDGRNQVRNIIRKCVVCARHKPRPVDYVMGNLPKERITQAQPFTYTGVDYCGPFFIKEKKYRSKQKIKVWICIFVCFTIKAVHIEIVSDLSSEEFLATFSRFLSRHPTCKFLYSDNATTFVGAKNELQELYTFLKSEENKNSIQQNLQGNGVEWSFIPPASPHCGGIWEAAVKSCKHNLKRVMGNESLTYEQLNTLCIKIEGILNSRPLTPLSSDPNDLTALTPAHFLHGVISRDVPAPDWSSIPTNRLSYWQHLEKIKQHFWTRWYKEYLNELNIQTKWSTGNHDIILGSLALLRDDNLPPLRWRLGRVIEIYPAQDGGIRKVKLKTSTGVTERNVRRLAPLPVDN